MMGKRGRPAFRRTTSMTGFAVQLGNIEASPPTKPPGAQFPMIGGEFDQMFPPRCNQKNSPVDEFQLETADFLRSCGLCNLRLIPGRDIYMYRGDTAFCSLECRELQMKQDERKERRATAAAINGQSHRSELVAVTPDAAGKTGTIVAV